MTRYPRCAVLGALLLLSSGPLAADDARYLAIHQARQMEAEPPAVRVYLDVLDADREPVTTLDRGSLSATLGDQSMTLRHLTPFGAAGEGVAYLFLVDVSRSLSAEQFAALRDALTGWISDLEPADRSTLVSFGDRSRQVVDFTGDASELIEALASLGPTDGSTVLYRAIQDALTLADRRDPALPARRALVVLSDGRDEGSGLAIDDVLERIEEAGTPIYAIGYSQLPEAERQTYLEVLHRLASNSGGAYFEADRTRIGSAYEAIRQAIRRVWVADLACPACRADGRVSRLQVHLRAGGRVLTHGTELRLLPEPPPPGDGVSGRPAPAARTEEAARPSTATSPPEGSEAEPRGRGWAVALALVVVAGALLLGTWHRIRPRRKREDEDLESTLALPLPEPQDPAGPTSRRIRFVVVRGSRRGREYQIFLGERALVGTRSDNHLVLADEPGIAPAQFELFQEDGRAMIRNLDSRSPTLLDGRTFEGTQALKSNDLIGSRETILRILIDR